MYSYDNSMRAVKLYIQYDYSFSSVQHELGYPNNRKTLKAWYKEFEKTKTLHKKFSRKLKYSSEQKQLAINYYYKHGRCLARTVRKLGFPSRTVLGEWLREIHPEDFPHCAQSTSLVKLTKAQKENAVLDLCSRTGSARDVADQYGVSRISLYAWKHKLFPDWSPTQMMKDKAEYHSTSKNIEDLKCEVKTLADEATQLRQQVHRLKLEKEALEIVAKIIKKDQGISLDTLSNREKAIVIDVLRNKYSLKQSGNMSIPKKNRF